MHLPGIPLPVLPLCLGTATIGVRITEGETMALFDRFHALGGNFIDTARVYSDWVPGEKNRSERILGDWIKSRGLRDKLVLATKGMHPEFESENAGDGRFRGTVPRSSVAEIRSDLEGSLRSLQTDVIDLYWLHRDDPSRPVGDFIDTLNAFVREGKIRAFGASNWTADRLRAAHDYARESGQTPFAASQPLWSLGCQRARPPLIPGLVVFDAAAARFHEETGTAVIPYSSQANGFFSKFALPPEHRPAGFEKMGHYVAANLAAGKLVVEFAAAKVVAPSAIVLAYLWSHNFPVIPVVGCLTIAQLEDSMAALPVRLSAEELRSLETASQSGLQGMANL